ncbi:MAG: thermonuclease family protein [Alphaproteobacteria bacterium]
MRLRIVYILALALVGVVPAAGTEQPFEGPVWATVVRVVDGDTIAVRARIWLGQDVETMVRVAGVDAPELHGHCDEEKILARKAQAFVEASVAGGSVRLRDVRYDKYGNRVVARVESPAGSDLADQLIAAGLGHAYQGERRLPWCQ